MSADTDDGRGPAFMLAVLLGGLVFGFGLALSGMAKPEIVLDFLQFDDLGLLFVMGGAAVVSGVTFFGATRFLDRAPLTGRAYTRRLKTMDRNVPIGGVIFGVGWGVSGICPGAAYASVGIGNLPILWAVLGMFLGAYAQGYVRSYRAEDADSADTAPTD
ncbi:YeeE/YedE family protein [Halomarina litorea]|uniref:YeeE/YedE family protein n=1 Tax=Halomarina litorea TaxID=2961595 RepID=UPI0020C48B84|nr:YeeE/YedE family protein [Halomarina sp. BCD28]